MIVTFNRINLTKQTIDDLYNSANADFDLVIIDNGSTDGTVEYLKTLKNVITVFNEENKGIARGRNQGLLEANKLNTEWYVTLDNDVLLPKYWLRDCIEILQTDPTFGMIGVNFEPNNYPLIKAGNKMIQEKSKGNLGTACSVYNRKLHKMLGYYNTNYSQFYGLEDSDHGLRARVLGIKMGYLAEKGIHLGDNEIGEYREFKTKQHDSYVDKFKENASLYYSGKKPIYIPCKI